MGEVSWRPGEMVVYLFTFFALVMGYLVLYCVLLAFLSWSSFYRFWSLLSFLFSFPFITRFPFPSGPYTIHELIGRSVNWLVGTVRYDINWNLMYSVYLRQALKMIK